MTLTAKDLRGMTVATVLPFHEDGSIDWAGYEAVLDHCAQPATTDCVFVNGHAGEATALTDSEKFEVIRRTKAQISKNQPLLAGVVPTGYPDAVRQVDALREAGADVAVIFPPEALGGGNANTRAGALFMEKLAREVQMPLSVFQFPIGSGFGFSSQVLAEMAQIPEVLAIKEGSALMQNYEANLRAVAATGADCAILASNFMWFHAQCAVGADGILSGLTSLCPQLLSDLWKASEANDLVAMRAASDRLYPIIMAIYGPAPVVDMHTRMKDGLKLMGIIKNSAPRLPLLPQNPAIVSGVEAALKQAGLL
ncbi:dihydrodipicolinate synthase family protein [Falsigemmobacter faecalis]|uniref:Dihydrodipicolinate synthase family protein n=1 Tax=Falsigemmobacter faecalis TaxID=2488730 RepID=A0A3P3D3K9_9RHOB|nr:dihydrodipicolinate synthase family protein [Falsigemmobacter faecalis]RRH69000.1 dihydrodipicolinate synthase family protein [Falsigemmobacter faecalis]